jgi:hypothetical protein
VQDEVGEQFVAGFLARVVPVRPGQRRRDVQRAESGTGPPAGDVQALADDGDGDGQVARFVEVVVADVLDRRPFRVCNRR